MGEIREIAQLGAKVLRLTAQAVEVHSKAHWYLHKFHKCLISKETMVSKKTYNQLI
jgi:hypothetical protein